MVGVPTNHKFGKYSTERGHRTSSDILVFLTIILVILAIPGVANSFCSSPQSDAGSGQDAGSSCPSAVLLLPYLNYGACLDASDTRDYFKFYVNKNENIDFGLDSLPASANFDVFFYDPSGSLRLQNNGGSADRVSYVADVSGYWCGQIFRVSGEGTYGVSVDLPTNPPNGCPSPQDDAGSGGDASNLISSPVQIDMNASYQGCLGTNDLYDYYKFYVSAGSDFAVTLTPPGSADFDLYLYTPSGNSAGISSKGAGQVDNIEISGATGGWWKMGIDWELGSGNYGISASLPQNQNDPLYEPNDTFGQAKSISLGQSYTSYIWNSSDEDYFKFIIPETGDVDIQLTSLPADYDIILFDSSNNELQDSDEGGTDNESILRSCLPAGDYFVHVYGYSGASDQSDTYRLRIDFDAKPLPAKATSSSPVSGSTIPSTSTVTLDWANSSDAQSYDIYFGPTSSPPWIGSTGSSNYGPMAVSEGQMYYWRISSINSCFSRSGDLWNFQVDTSGGGGGGVTACSAGCDQINSAIVGKIGFILVSGFSGSEGSSFLEFKSCLDNCSPDVAYSHVQSFRTESPSSIASKIKFMADELTNQESVDEIVVVAHSTGGLGARWAIHGLGLDQNFVNPKIKKLILLDSPHHGAGKSLYVSKGFELIDILDNLPSLAVWEFFAMSLGKKLIDIIYERVEPYAPGSDFLYTFNKRMIEISKTMTPIVQSVSVSVEDEWLVPSLLSSMAPRYTTYTRGSAVVHLELDNIPTSQNDKGNLFRMVVGFASGSSAWQNPSWTDALSSSKVSVYLRITDESNKVRVIDIEKTSLPDDAGWVRNPFSEIIYILDSAPPPGNVLTVDLDPGPFAAMGITEFALEPGLNLIHIIVKSLSDTENPNCELGDIEGGVLTATTFARATASDNVGVEYVEFQFSFDKETWHWFRSSSGSSPISPSRDYQGTDGWEYLVGNPGLDDFSRTQSFSGDEIWIRGRSVDVSGNVSDWDVSDRSYRFSEGFEEFPSDAEFVIYPNPAVGGSSLEIVIADIPHNSLIRIYDLTGGLVARWMVELGPITRWNAKNRAESDVAAGIYIVLVEDVNGVTLKKRVAIVR